VEGCASDCSEDFKNRALAAKCGMDALLQGFEHKKKLPEEVVAFGNHLEACFKEALEEAKGDKTRTEQLQILASFEIAQKGKELGEISDSQLLDALKLGAETSALSIVTKDFNESLAAALGDKAPTSSTVDGFLTVLGNMADACGDSEDKELVGEEKKLIGTQAAMDNTPQKIWEKCQEEVMDVDFLAEHGGLLSHKAACSSHVAALLEQKSAELRPQLNYRIKQFMVLHDKQNALGHRLAEHMRSHGVAGHLTHPQSAAALHQEFKNAVLGNLSQAKLERLQYLEDGHFEALHGQSKESYCAQLPKRPQLGGYTQCWCVDGLPETVCRVKHSAEVEREMDAVFEKLRRARKAFRASLESQPPAPMEIASGDASAAPPGSELAINGDASAAPPGSELAINASRKVPPGLCDPPAVCMLCSGSACGRRGYKKPYKIKNFFVDVQNSLVRSSSVCLKGQCSVLWGWPIKKCQLKMKFSMGASLDKCGNAVEAFSSFNVYIMAELCLGGVLEDIADALGWSSCKDIFKIKYYVFIGRLSVSVGLPVFLPGVQGRFTLGAPVHDLTKPVRDYIHNSPYNRAAIEHKEFMCLIATGNPAVFAAINLGCAISDMGHDHETKLRLFFTHQFQVARGVLEIKFEVEAWFGTWHTVASWTL